MNQTEWGSRGRSLNVFVSSPTDVLNERRLVSSVIEEINLTIGYRFRITLQLRMWERFRPGAESPMKFIERQLSDCDLFVMIFSRRFGSSVLQDGEYKSGTEQEYEVAQSLRAKSQDKRPEIFPYFKRITDEATLSDPGPELKKVLEFKEKIKTDVFFKEYTTEETFVPMLKDNIIEWMFEIFDRMGTDEITERKRAILQKFFALGSARDSRPSVRIVYPPISWVGIEQWADITHLLPYMVLEDFQAIHKFTKDLNIAGCDDVKAMTTEVYEERSERFANKILICLPRNPYAQRYLKKIPENRFNINTSTEDDKEIKYIVWKGGRNDKPIHVYSPQSKYLLMQRKKQGVWKNDPGSCTAVDFAVLARFRDPSIVQFPEIGNISCLFVFGIRGLGTWGAAWYIDRCYEDLYKKITGDECVQVLLRVEYRNHRIRSVIDVSEKPQEYFDKENSDKFIKSVINRQIA